MTAKMNRVITDDAEVQALAERLGVWTTIAKQLAADQSGALVADGWVFTFFSDGLVAFKSDNQAEQAMLMAEVAAHIGPPTTCGIGFHKSPASH